MKTEITNFEEKVKQLKTYFTKKPQVTMAYVFGSYAKDRVMSESDFDIAVYFKPENNKVECEEKKKYPEEDIIWNEVEKIVGISTDFVVMNRCPSTLADEILKTGKEILVKDRGLWLDFMLVITSLAEDFREFAKDFHAIKQRSKSLNEQDKNKLLKRIDFIIDEMKLYPRFKKLDWIVYTNNSLERKIVERWIENLCNASIDIAKIILASEQKKIPDTYKETLQDLALLESFDKDTAFKLSEFSKLRNILAHEYLDIRFEQIKKFILETKPLYKYLVNFVNKLI